MWRELLAECEADSVFLTPDWQQAWWDVFRRGRELLPLAIYHDERLVGLAPLMREGEILSFVGSSDVCDYLDFVFRVGHEAGAAAALLSYLAGSEWKTLDLEPLLETSLAMKHFVPLARRAGYVVESAEMDVTITLDLPASWEDYQEQLPGKDRHELRRKMRRLAREGKVELRRKQSAAGFAEDMEDFFRLFERSRSDKANFMTPLMRDFFVSLARAMALAGHLRLLSLYVEEEEAAVVMGFDYARQFYLYNSGYNPRYSPLSVGLILKAMCIEASIAEGMKRFDFLRGGEDYKYRLGGQVQPVFRTIVGRPQE